MTATSIDHEARHQIVRVRHATRRRLLTVRETQRLSPGMRRVILTAPDLADFESAAPDDHVKLFLRDARGEECMRDFTPRAFDRARCLLTLDFALHQAGPATTWAATAKPGDHLEIGGPRGSVVVPDDFDWYLFIGDETGLPAIGRWVEGLRAAVEVTTLVMVDDARDEQAFATAARWHPHWVHRGDSGATDTTAILDALKTIPLSPGDGFVWIAAEASTARAVRTHVTGERGHPSEWLKASGYWLRGTAGAHEKLGPG